jgi:hypothetical protein
MTSYQKLFTPAFILIGLCIAIGGIIGLQVLDRLFLGSKNLNAIRMFGIGIIINIIILVFLIMSFSKVSFAPGGKGPTGNKGDIGYTGRDGGLDVCGNNYQTVEQKKSLERSLNYLDLKPPQIDFR